MCDKEVSYTALYSQYIESFNDVKIYTKPGLTKDSYLVTTEVSLKYANIDTLVPGLDFFYVEKNDQGKLYINNTYGTFNRNNNVYELDPQVSELYELFIRQDDLRDMRNDVQDSYDEALKKDPALATLMNETLHEAIVQWNKDYDEQAAAAAEAEAQAEQEAAEAAAAEAEEAEAEAAEEEAPAEEEASTSTGRTNARANVRAEADKDSEKLGSVEQGTTVTIYGEEGDFYKFDYNGTQAYITKSAIDLDSEAGADDSSDEEATTGGSVAEGTVITLTSTTNIRAQMDQSSSKVAVAYSGEKVTVIMSYAEGWTKVKYGNKEGYIRTDLLQQ
jgi:ribosomal protein L12E/L44/L45/RPP1/RPP2